MDLLLWMVLGLVLVIMTCFVIINRITNGSKQDKKELESRVTELEKKFKELQK
ncbi:hypothetical protein [Radiobacillus deserti]|uniref:hypothetical protein n=1 Tax=Radiobacillus deserti TaxID=2594883 RepID=UPI00131559F3|nr:hypothetical protein [Radiobacillus deserti]